MACMAPAISSSPSFSQIPSRRRYSTLVSGFCSSPVVTVCSSGTSSDGHPYFQAKLSYAGQKQGSGRDLLKPIHAVSAGIEASMAEPLDDIINFRNVEIAVESEDAGKIQLRVELNGAETQKAFDIVLKNLARSAPPIPGFRREKGGKTSKVPKGILLDMLGEERVIKFVMREIVTSTLSTYSKKENLSVKENKVSTVQTEDELKQLFSPGSAFGFSAVLELENAAAEMPETTSGNSDL